MGTKPRLSTTLVAGLKTGLSLTWKLARITFPVTFLVGVLKYTAVVGMFTRAITPLMNVFGLPGESVFAYVLGALLNIYAAIGAILAVDLTVKQVFILAVMLSLAHNLLVETAVTSQAGVHPAWMALCRLGLACTFAFLFNLLWQGGSEQAHYALVPVTSTVPDTWGGIFAESLHRAFMGLMQMTLIIIPIMLFIQILKDAEIMPALVKLLSPLTRLLGLSEKTSLMLVAGILFGIAYGAGVIIQSAAEDNVSRKDIYLVCFFLACSHSVIEDTLIFIPLGINVLWLLLFRLLLAVLATATISRLWRQRA
jgi:hypothetical protein